MRISDWSSDVCSSDLIFRKQVSDRRASFGYRFKDGKPLPINQAFKEYRKSLVEKGALYKHSIRFDIASYFNSIYHHDLAHWFESKTGVSAEDSAGFRSEERRVGKECVSRCRSR